MFPQLEFTSDLLSPNQRELPQKTILLEILENNKVIGKTQFALKDAFLRSTSVMQLFLLNGCKLSGTLDVSSFKAVRCCTFFDLIFKNRLNIVPIVGVDFSMANLTMEDNSFCNHSLKPGAPNDYISCLKAI